MDNLDFGLDAEVNHKLAVMRSVPGRGVLADGVVPSLGCFFSIDPEGDVSGDYEVGNGKILSLKFNVRVAPRWLAMHVTLGGINLSDASVFGIVCKPFAEQAITVRPALRSAAPKGFVDAFFPKHVVAFAAPSTHVDLLKLQGREDVPKTADWRELVLFFGTESGALTLRDLRVFIA